MGANSRKQIEIEIRKKDIVDAAEEVFFSKGFENATMNDIAKKAEYSKPTLYAYFTGKEEILFLVHMKGNQIKMERLRHAIEGQATGYDKLYAFGDAYYKFYKDYPEHLRIQIFWDYKGLNFDKVSPKISESFHEWVATTDEVTQLFRLGIEDGSLRDDVDIKRTMELFFLSLRTIANQILLIKPPNVSPLDDLSEEVYYHYLDLFLESIKVKK